MYGNAEVYGNADYCCFQSFGSRYGTTIVFREKDGNLRVRCGCFNGTLDEFAAKVQQTHGDSEAEAFELAQCGDGAVTINKCDWEIDERMK